MTSIDLQKSWKTSVRAPNSTDVDPWFLKCVRLYKPATRGDTPQWTCRGSEKEAAIAGRPNDAMPSSTSRPMPLLPPQSASNRLQACPQSHDKPSNSNRSWMDVVCVPALQTIIKSSPAILSFLFLPLRFVAKSTLATNAITEPRFAASFNISFLHTSTERHNFLTADGQKFRWHCCR